jgi:hypothetical protein
MNEPIEYAQKTTGKVSARDLLQVVKTSPSHCFLHGVAAYDRASYSDSFIFTLTSRREKTTKHAASDTTIDVPGYVSNGHTSETKEHISAYDHSAWMSYSEVYRPLRGFWSLNYCEQLVNVLQILPPAAEVGLFVYLDAGTNELLVRAKCEMNHYSERGLHCDKLYLVASWMKQGKRIERQYLIDSQVSAHNTARFGSPKYDRDGQGNTQY